jgi:hypothetical protein
MASKFLADDFAAIARGLAELEAGREPAESVEDEDEVIWFCMACQLSRYPNEVTLGRLANHRCNGCNSIVHRFCDRCNNTGWVKPKARQPWMVCGGCGNPFGRSSP